MAIHQTEIIITRDGVELGRHTVESGEYVFGREGDIPIQTDSVSRRHARLTLTVDSAYIEDLGSSNGTRVNGKPIDICTRLWPNQKIQIGTATIELRRIRTQSSSDLSLAPAQQVVKHVLPEEFLREKKYDIGGVVAQGGMGAILDAKEATIERSVAMKVMHDGYSPDDLLRFLNEAKITGQLEHPNIVPVHELSLDENGQPFYTMKFVKGITLQKVLALIAAADEATVKKYPLAALLTDFQKVCDALAFAHSKGIIHRDLKPENIMIGDYGEVLVMDWGLAKRMGEREGGKAAGADDPVYSSLPTALIGIGSTLAGSVMGTPQFMPPEQARGEVECLDARSDIYSLGAILYQILSLRFPVNGNDSWDIVGKVTRGEIDPLTVPTRKKNSKSKAAPLPHLPGGELPESLAAVVRKAMALTQDARYQTVPEFQADIKAYQNGFATKAERAGAWKQLTLFIKRNKAVATATAAAFLIILVVVGVAFFRVNREKNTATLALAELRGTAPTFAEQAKSLIEVQKFDEALEKIGFAIKLDSDTADYHRFRANTLQAMARLTEAAEAYRRTLALKPDDDAAKSNLALCEKLLAENHGNDRLTLPLKSKLLDAILSQKRQADAVPLSQELKRDSDTALTLIKMRLKVIMAQPAWTQYKLGRVSDGTFQLDLRGHNVTDLSILEDLPITSLDISDRSDLDLTPLRKVPLRSLTMNNWKSGSLEGLRGMKLTGLSLRGSKFTDISALKGMPLKRLDLYSNLVNDISPLRGMPLEYLDLSWISATDASPLQGLPLRTLHWPGIPMRNLAQLRGLPLETLSVFRSGTLESLDGIQGSPLQLLSAYDSRLTDISALKGLSIVEADLGGNSISDFTALSGCQKLERLLLSPKSSDIAHLQKLPKLGRIGFGNLSAYSNSWNTVPMAAEFWKKNGERLKRQVPQEKQLEKFHQSLIAQGNDPDKLPRFAFSMDGKLVIKLQPPAVGKCTDISGLRGVAVNEFYSDRQISDIAPLAGAPLEYLFVSSPSISDLSPLRGAPLKTLHIPGTAVSDLSPLRGAPLERLWIARTRVTDMSVLLNFPLLKEVLLPSGANNIEALKKHANLSRISFNGGGPGGTIPAQTAAEFWKEFDTKKAAEAK